MSLSMFRILPAPGAFASLTPQNLQYLSQNATKTTTQCYIDDQSGWIGIQPTSENFLSLRPSESQAMIQKSG